MKCVVSYPDVENLAFVRHSVVGTLLLVGGAYGVRYESEVFVGCEHDLESLEAVIDVSCVLAVNNDTNVVLVSSERGGRCYGSFFSWNLKRLLSPRNRFAIDEGRQVVMTFV